MELLKQILLAIAIFIIGVPVTMIMMIGLLQILSPLWS